MKIGVIGSGGREHAICKIISKSKKLEKLYCFPGNAGTFEIAENVEINSDNFEELKNFILLKEIDLIIVGPEKPLVNGIVDYLKKFNIKVFGPNQIASKLEGSKIFTKNICQKFKIPTAKFGVFDNEKKTKEFLFNSKYPVVIKADNLASGKGVYICKNENESNIAVNEIFTGKFGKAKQILIEEFLEGEEMSYFIISDGITIKNFGTAQDHKRVFEGDKGPNTGGMGAYSPSRLITKELEIKIIKKIIEPTILALKELGVSFEGFLYAGLMIVKDEPFLIEYNVRMGDPECQTILPKLQTDFIDIIDSCCNKKLNEISIKWNNKKSLCVVICSNGYPGDFQKNIEIKDFNSLNLKEDDFIFHAGTINKNKKIYSNGGRVLNFVSLSDNFNQAKDKVYDNLKNLNWKEGFYRKDIGFKVLKK